MGRAVTDDEVSRMMEEVDADGDGCISLPEFAALMESASADAAAVEEDLRHAFMVFDADGSGLITPAELARVLRGLGGVCHRFPDLTPNTTPLGRDYVYQSRGDGTNKMLNEMRQRVEDMVLETTRQRQRDVENESLCWHSA